jgi:hypothetical protein
MAGDSKLFAPSEDGDSAIRPAEVTAHDRIRERAPVN